MQKIKELKPEKLRAYLDPTKISYEDSTKINGKSLSTRFQPRALHALELALSIKGNEYNVYVAGEPNMGRTYFVKSFLDARLSKAPTPPDWIYLHNFEDEDRPVAIQLPAGMGRKFKHAQAKAISRLRVEIPARLEKESFQKKHEDLIKKFNARREEHLTAMEDIAGKQNFNLNMDDEGLITLAPIIDGKVIRDKDFDKLSPAERKQYKAAGESLLDAIAGDMRKLNRNEADLRKSEEDLFKETARSVFNECYAPVREKFGNLEALKDYYEDIESEVADNVDQFTTREAGISLFGDPNSGEDFFNRFEVNLFVDNGKTKGAPVITEDHPTVFNLLGSIERESEMGALHTDFLLVKAGAIHKANHGFLILNVEDLLTNPSSWEGLLRALRANQSRIEDPVDPDQFRTRTIQPEPIPLDLRVILIGTDIHYEMLLYNDDRFAKYFKLKAHMQDSVDRKAPELKAYLSVIGCMAKEANTLPFNREALGGLLDEASRLVEDQRRLSLSFPVIRERMIEASALAISLGKDMVDADTLNQAIKNRDFRSNLFEDEFMREYDREVIKVETRGKAAGQANGLSVTLFGDYEFGLPHRIACTVGVGHGGILDLEREAQLGGPIHTKGMMILKSYLLGLFAQDKPIVMTGSLCFEQSYAGIEGDSASGAELAALLSALSGVPINLSLAFTGAVSQSGAIMAVGGVNRKIEGFFEVCRRRGLTGEQGVLLPADNVVNLMLKDDVINAVAEGKFHIYPVTHIEEAMYILTGMRAGSRGKNGKFQPGTLYNAVDTRLAELAKLAAPGDKH